MRERCCIIAPLVDLKDFVILEEATNTEHCPLVFGEFVIPKLVDLMLQSPSFGALIVCKPCVFKIDTAVILNVSAIPVDPVWV